ncbi:hypothetical protein IAT38_008248 [Cryptococcus sp. DSM 104549]
MLFQPLLLLATSFPVAQAATYTLTHDWKGNDFYDNFDFKTFDDPTHGRVNYVDMDTAKAQNLSWAGDNTFVMRADAYNTVDSSARGRNSVRIHSKNTFTNGVVMLDVKHIPVGCGTWPAFWSCTRGSWPVGGEIDIIEGVHGRGRNLASLHTSSGCDMPSSRYMSGDITSNSCGGSSSGCGAVDDNGASFGQDFNANGGGIFVMLRDDSRGIKVWFWPHNDGFLPFDISTSSHTIFESLWGEPFAYFPSTDSCNLPSFFRDHEFIINLTFCGDWAASAWGASGCAGDIGWACDDFVNKNPGAFADAYWEISGMRWYDQV